MISVSLEGMDDVMAAIRRIPSSLGTETALEEVGQQFSARLRAATPKGYSGRLRDSVVSDMTGGVMLVGYEEGVETAGNPKLDSVRVASTRGRSVLRKWVQAEDLESVLEETFDAYASEVATVFERRLANVVS